MENKIIEVNMIILGLRKIFRDDVRKMILYGCGLDIKKSKRIASTPNEFFTLKSFYESEVSSYLKNKHRSYDYFEKLQNNYKNNKMLIVNISKKTRIKDWECVTKPCLTAQ